MRWVTGMRAKRAWMGAVCAGLIALGGALPARGAAPEPNSVFFANQTKGPDLEGACGLVVTNSGSGVYVSNYYHHSVDLVAGTFLTPLISNIDPLDGPCGLSLDSTGRLYVNNYHRNVERYLPVGAGFGPATAIDSSHPTGVAVDFTSDNVYVDARTYVSAYGSSGAPIMNGPEPLKIGVGSLEDGYGLAVSRFPGTLGRLYVPDHGDDTLKVYDPLIDIDDPVQTISGPPGGFGSLRDSTVAVDRVTGEVYVADTLTYPQYTEHPEATIYVFDALGAYKGRLKYNIVDGSPPGLAVNNSVSASQGGVYVTSGNTVQASIYFYPPGAATNFGAPAVFSLSVGVSEGGSVASSVGDVDCSNACEQQIRSGADVSLTADPDPGFVFAGWSGGGCSSTGECVVTMSQARSVRAEFMAMSGPLASSSSSVTQKGNLRVSVSGKLAPKRLPRKGTAPISVSVGGRISTTDASLPPQLKTLRIELNRNGHLDYAGLPRCDYDRIQPGSSSRALSSCRSSLVGRGSFTADIALAGQEPYPTRGRLLVFNGAQHGKPVLFGHIYSPHPFATSFVIVFAIQRLGGGTYGTALDASLPSGMDAWGRLTSLEMTLTRRYSVRGRAHDFISAGCPAPQGFPSVVFPFARTSFSFEDGKKLSTVLTSSCLAS
jgi:hypothetical protein